MMILKKRVIILILLDRKASSLLMDTFDFIKAKRPFSGKAGKINPPYFLDNI